MCVVDSWLHGCEMICHPLLCIRMQPRAAWFMLQAQHIHWVNFLWVFMHSHTCKHPISFNIASSHAIRVCSVCTFTRSGVQSKFNKQQSNSHLLRQHPNTTLQPINTNPETSHDSNHEYVQVLLQSCTPHYPNNKAYKPATVRGWTDAVTSRRAYPVACRLSAASSSIPTHLAELLVACG